MNVCLRGDSAKKKKNNAEMKKKIVDFRKKNYLGSRSHFVSLFTIEYYCTKKFELTNFLKARLEELESLTFSLKSLSLSLQMSYYLIRESYLKEEYDVLN